MIGGDVDLDLLSLFPQINSTSMGGIESRASFFEVNNGGERAWEKATAQGDVVTQHTTACCSIQVIDITLMKYQFTNITSLRVVQQKHSGLYSSTEYYKP
jgi:hypothetical protein